MRTKIQRWGNSLALRVPKHLAAETQLGQDTLVELAVIDGKLTVTPIKLEPTLAQLLEAITPENRHLEVDSGDQQGLEVW